MTARAAEAEGHVDVDVDDGAFGQSSDYTQISYHDLVASMGWSLPDRDEFPEFNNECGTDSYFYFGHSQGFSRLWRRLKAALETRDIDVRYATGASELTNRWERPVTGVIAQGPEAARSSTRAAAWCWPAEALRTTTT